MTRDSNHERDALLEQNLARLIRSELAVQVRPMRADQVLMVIREAAVRIRPAAEFPLWGIFVLIPNLVGLIAYLIVITQSPRLRQADPGIVS
jgi:hypothetical protein